MAQNKRMSVRLTLQQAKLVLLAKAIEESNDSRIHWSSADSEAASLRAAHTVGESADTAKLLTERAKVVLRTVSERGISTTVSTKARLPQFFSPLFVLLAFILGALTDRIASPEHIVNLLSPPYWGVILWNLVVYFALFCCAIGLVGTGTNRFALPLRSSLGAFVQKTSYGTLRRTGFKSHFYSEWSSFVAPLIRMNVARTLHFAAVFFALGIIVSLLVRGFGTSYWAGWESTWLAESPESVKAFIDHTYGLIPAVGPLSSMPDLAQIVDMRADRLPYLEAPITAAPWLIRMMILMGVTVIVPRLFFAMFDTWRMRRFKTQTALSIDSPYYENILVQCAQDAVLGNLMIVTSTANRPLRDQTASILCKHWGNAEDSTVKSIDFDDEESTVPAIAEGPRKPIVLLWFDGIETPEEDVHGAVIERLREAYEAKGSAVFAALLDMKEFAQRFASTPSRIQERKDSWLAMSKSHQVKLFDLDGTSESQLTTIKALRAWAAPRVSSNQIIVTDKKENNNEQ